MTDLRSDVDAPSDAELISRVRGGDVAGYGELFSRHQAAANRLARQLVRGPDADDLVSEAFAKVLTVLQGGGGPDVAFRAYLLTAVRRLHVDRVRVNQRLQTTDDMTPFDPGVPFQDTAVAGFESGAAAKAFASLPERWQLVLWHLEVEGQKPADIAPLLGMSANSVSALAYRAREGLRQAFLTMHLSDISETDCRWVNEHLGAFVRKGLSKRDAGKVQGHLDECRRCTAMYLELTDVNSNLAGIIAPLLLGAAATGYLASGGAGIAAGGIAGLVSRVKDFVGANTGAVAAAGVAAGVAAVAAAAVLTLGGNDEPSTTADPATGSSTAVPSSVAPTTPAPSPTPTPSKSAASRKSPSASASPSTATTPATQTTASSSASASVSPSATLPAAITALTELPTDAATSPGATTSPGDGSTGTPPPPPAGGAPTITSLSIDPDGGSMDLVLDGLRDPSTPVGIALQSSQTTFGTSMAPGCSRGDPRHVRCLPGTAAAAGRAAAVGAVSAADPGHYEVTLPLEFPDDMDSDELVIVVSIDGATQSSSQAYTFRPSPRERLALGALHVLDHDRLIVRAPISGVRSGTARLTLTGDAAFGDPVTSGCSRDSETSVTCTGVPPGSSDLDVAVRLTSDRADTVTLRINAVRPFFDPDGSDNSRPLPPAAAFAMTGLSPDPASSTDGSYAVTSTVTVPKGLDRLTFASGDGATFASTAGCTPNDDNTRITCERGTGASYDQAFVLVATHADADTDAAVSLVVPDDYLDLDPGDNAASGTLSAVPVVKHADVALTLPASVPAEDDGGYRVTGALTGVPSDYPGKVTYGASNGASFDPDAPLGCALESDTLVCEPAEHPAFHLVADDNSAPTVATITVSPLSGYVEDNPGDNAATTTLETFVPDADLSLTVPGSVDPSEDDGSYAFNGTLHGVPSDYKGTARYSVTSGAAFVAGDDCTVDSGDLVCDAENGSVPFHLTATDNHTDTAVTITVAPLAGHTDKAPDNNSDTATLRRFVPKADVSLRLPSSPPASDDGEYRLDGTLAGVPDGFDDKARFSLAGAAAFVAGNGCTLSAATLVCDATNGPVPFHLKATDNHSSTPVTIRVAPLSGYDDPSTGNNSDATTLQRFTPDADLSLTVPGSVDPSEDDGSYAFKGTLHGVPSDYKGTARYSVTSGAAFVAGDACTVDSGDLVCPTRNGAVPFHLTATDNRTDTTVTITVVPLAGHTDKTPGNNSDTTTLRRFVPKADVSLRLTSSAPASEDGEYRLDGTLAGVPDGFDEKARFSLAGAAAFVAGNGCTLSAATLVCDAANGPVPFHLTATDNRSSTPVRIRVAPLSGYDDPSTGNNSADTTLQRFTPDADLSLTVPGSVDPSEEGDYTFDGTLAGVPSDYTGQARYSVSRGAVFVAGDGCTVSSGDLVCDADNGSVPFHLSATNNRTDTPVTITVAPLTGHTDKTPANNSDTTTLQTFVPDADLSLTVPGSVDPSDDGDYTFDGTLHGVPSDFTGQARYSVSGGASFVAGDGCTVDSGGNLVCEADNGSVPFHLTATDNRTDTPVTITVAPLAGHIDMTPGNNSDTTTLQAYVPPVDVSLDSLQRISVRGSTNLVRAGVSGVPSNVTTFYVDLSGDAVGSAGNQVHFIHGADGASGAGTVTCAVTSPTRVTCHLLKPSFTIDMDVQHPQGRPDLDVTMTVTAVNSGEPASNLENNSGAVAIR